MAGRETAEEKIARIVRSTMQDERQRQEDAADPRIGKLRGLIRDEVASVLGEFFSDSGEGGRRTSRRRKDEDEGEEERGSFLGLLG